jgi:hypothetical protein
VTRIAIEGTDFRGRTSSLPWRLPQGNLDCTRCGSSLAGRRQKVRWSTVGGATYEIESYRCRCGRGRHIRREVADR